MMWERMTSCTLLLSSQHQTNPPVTNSSVIGLLPISQGKHFSGNFKTNQLEFLTIWSCQLIGVVKFYKRQHGYEEDFTTLIHIAGIPHLLKTMSSRVWGEMISDVEVKKESLIVMKEVELMLLEHFK